MVTRLLSVISGAIAEQKARLAAVKSAGVEAGALVLGPGGEGSWLVDERVRSMMPTTSAAAASAMATPMAMAVLVLR